MGAWGYYDDENDMSCETWYNFADLIDSRRTDGLSAEGVVLYEYKRDPIKFWKQVESYVYDDTVLYVCWHLVKVLGNVKTQHQPLYGIPPETELPVFIPHDFPEGLRTMVIDKIEMELASDHDDWMDPISRQKALNHELYVFSKGEKGSDSTGKVIQNGFQKMFASFTAKQTDDK